mmetsp:Transcript_34537/g.77881  ORF Transcript_34537/g.77881 Transcript_34537/m.77881 type:complete len:102 (+) Transcript_34537:536-841(+)
MNCQALKGTSRQFSNSSRKNRSLIQSQAGPCLFLRLSTVGSNPFQKIIPGWKKSEKRRNGKRNQKDMKMKMNWGSWRGWIKIEITGRKQDEHVFFFISTQE